MGVSPYFFGFLSEPHCRITACSTQAGKPRNDPDLHNHCKTYSDVQAVASVTYLPYIHMHFAAHYSTFYKTGHFELSSQSTATRCNYIINFLDLQYVFLKKISCLQNFYNLQEIKFTIFSQKIGKIDHFVDQGTAKNPLLGSRVGNASLLRIHFPLLGVFCRYVGESAVFYHNI